MHIIKKKLDNIVKTCYNYIIHTNENISFDFKHTLHKVER